MQSNDTPNQVPDAAPLIDASLTGLLTEIISSEDMEGMEKFLNDVGGDLLNSLDGTGLPQLQMPATSMGTSPVATQISTLVPSAQPLLPLLMMQSPHASAPAASQVQTGGNQQDTADRTEADVLIENWRLRVENQKLLAENGLLKWGNGAFIKRVQVLKLKVKELKLKLKGKVCLLDEMSFI